jgi:hypothetical protein
VARARANFGASSPVHRPFTTQRARLVYRRVMDSLPASTDATSPGLSRLVSTLSEDAIFVLASVDSNDAPEVLEAFGKRRAEAYTATVKGVTLPPRMGDRLEAWIADATRAIAPVAAPVWLPMGDLVKEKVTLEVGARGLRSLFSSKPSDKDVQRVKRLGTLSLRVLRAVCAADGPLNVEEQRAMALFVSALGLSAEDAAPLLSEAPVDPATLDVFGDLDPTIARGIVRGAWLAAAWDAIDPREEDVVRTAAKKLAVGDDAVESTRAEALKWVDARKATGQAIVDAIRFILSDRVPGIGVELAAKAGALVLPRRFREEVLAQVGHGTSVTLAKRHALAGQAQQTALGVAWAAALHDDPGIARRAVLRARFEKVAHDLGGSGDKPRTVVERWVDDTLATFA